MEVTLSQGRVPDSTLQPSEQFVGKSPRQWNSTGVLAQPGRVVRGGAEVG
jgi:hypothetical protein